MKRFFPLFLGAGLLAACGLLHGLHIDRWTRSAALEAASDRLSEVPATIGDWDGLPVDMDARQLAVANVTSHVARRYVQRGSGREVTVLLLCGRGGPLSVHQPDVCYTGAGYATAAPPEAWADPSGARFWMARFARPTGDPQPLRIFWAWGLHGDWAAPTQPRLELAREPAMYKLYVVQRMTRPDEPLDEGHARDFLQVLLPELRRRLGPAATERTVVGRAGGVSSLSAHSGG